MNLPRNSYYYKPKPREISPEDQAIIARIEEIAEDFATYGYRKITAQLRRDGIVVNRKKVQRIMREKGLSAKKTRRFVKTTDSNHPYPVYPNLLKGLKVTGVNQAWVADITLYPNRCLLRVSCRHSGPVLTEGDWIRDLPAHRHGFKPYCTSDGHRSKEPTCRPDPSLRPGCAVRSP